MQTLNDSTNTNVSIQITALDALMNLAGELVLGRNQLLQAISAVVDRIGNVVAVDPGEIDSPPANIGDVPGRCFDAVFKTDDQLVGLLSLQSIC
jgi:chemotaxis signal transduction protein